MTVRDTAESFGCVTKWLHRFVSLFIILQLIGGACLGFVPDQYKSVVYNLHKSMGVTIFFLLVIFLIWRLSNPRPVWPQDMKCWEKLLARTVHTTLYVGFIAMSLAGWILATAAGKPPIYFWLFSFPLPGIPLNMALAQTAATLHTYLAWAMTGVLILHILGALKHHLIDKNNILKRMM